MKYTKYLFCLILLAGCGLPARVFPQFPDYMISHVSLEQGLSQSGIEFIMQDRRGFLWIGTQDGLNRYDGYSFTVYKHEPSDPFSISHNTITTIYEDREGRLWLGTQKGLNCFYNGQFIRYPYGAADSMSLSSGEIYTITGDDSGYIWIGTYGGGLNRLDPVTGKITVFKNHPDDPNSLPSNSVRELCYTRNGELWAGTSRGLCLYSQGSFKIFQNHPDDPSSISGNSIYRLSESPSGDLWVSTHDHGLNRFNRRTGKAIRYLSQDRDLTLPDVTSVLELEDSTVWIGTAGGGLHVLYKNRIIYFRNDPSDPKSLSNNDITRIFADRSGNIWVGTMGGGLNKFRRNPFAIYSARSREPYRIPGNEVWSIMEDRSDNFWLSIRHMGLFKYEKQKTLTFSSRAPEPYRLTHSNVLTLHQDRSGAIWIGTYQGLNRYDGMKMIRFNYNPADSNGIPAPTIMASLEDSAGQLWFASFGGGFFRWIPDPKSARQGRFITFQHNPKNPNSLSNNDVFALMEDRQGHLWIGTFDGLNEFDGKNFTIFRRDTADRTSISHNTILCMHQSRDGTIWVGTDGGGVNAYRDGRFRAYTKKDGLPNNVIYGILEDASGHLWMSTNGGLCRLTPGKNGDADIRSFDVHDGLPSNEFNQSSYYRNKKGEMFFGGISGMIRFRPDELVASTYRPPVYITAFKIYDKPVSFGRDISEVGAIDIAYYDNFFSFEFVALDYTIPEKNQYAYQLVGFDRNWIYSGTRRYVSYTNLDGGNYIFKVKATNSHGVWNENSLEIKITIHPPFWKTAWFRVLLTLIIMSSGYFLYRTRVRAIQHRNVILEQRVHERTRMIEAKNAELEMKNEQIRRHQEQLIQAEKLSSLGRLVSSMSHEINNPLNFTCGSLNLLEQEIADAEALLKEKYDANEPVTEDIRKLTVHITAMKELAQTLQIGVGRIKDIAVGMRNFSVMHESEPVEVELHITVSYLLSLIRSQDRQNVEIHTELNAVPTIMGLPGQFNHAILNIIKNAIEFTQKKYPPDQNGHVWIKTYVKDGYIEISVRDDGPGIPEQHRHKIFEPFFTTKGVGEGTGLGLAISYGIIQNHHGDILCHSTPGEGSEFIIRIPLPSNDSENFMDDSLEQL